MSYKSKAQRRRDGSRPNPYKQARVAESRSQRPPPTPDADTKASSTVVALEPLAPIIVRSGRPFDSMAGVDEARFPPPSTIAGCLRAAWARATGEPFDSRLTARAIRGPLLVNSAGGVLAPKPADAQYVDVISPRCVRSKPAAFEADCDADLPAGLLPVQLTEPAAGKPVPGPHWWAWKHLIEFRRGNEARYGELEKQGWTPASGDHRTHVAPDRNTRAAAAGQLFQTEGLVMESKTAKDAARNGLRLLARFDEPMRESIVPLGGERRLAALAPQPESAWPAPPPNWLQEHPIIHGKVLRKSSVKGIDITATAQPIAPPPAINNNGEGLNPMDGPNNEPANTVMPQTKTPATHRPPGNDTAANTASPSPAAKGSEWVSLR